MDADCLEAFKFPSESFGQTLTCKQPVELDVSPLVSFEDVFVEDISMVFLLNLSYDQGKVVWIENSIIQTRHEDLSCMTSGGELRRSGGRCGVL